ncbi:hypothetical protein PENSOL_c041G06226 [Penicillium solitum]|uniref:Uncharacterized protein n=1 Tax=Penicillium solitum TaxID=60172 RepID=A0A1V6QU00_9EURO|nr:uncharacterized protein PENSOL_c041G06226 [Penicillium solitum]OQD92497.1 hypothetical protein PENSOL_c041G06226 [Penicillium solitum]
MPTDFSSYRERQRAATYLQARNDDGKHHYPPNSDPSPPTFFEPRGATWVAPVRIPDAQCEKEFKASIDGWENAKDHRLVQTVHSQACGTIVPSVFAEKFYSALWGSTRWAPAAAFVPKKPLDHSAKPPHTLIILLIKEEPGEDLFQAEVMVLTAAMITRLKGEECLDYNTIPAICITIFGRMKARVLEAHSTQQGLAIKKTQLLDFSTNQAANKNMDILLGFMAGDLIGDPTGLAIPTDIPKACTTDTIDCTRETRWP